MLSTDPLLPHVAMMRGELLELSSSMHMLPMLSRSCSHKEEDGVESATK